MRLLVVLALLAGCADSSGVCGEIYDDSKACWVKKARGDDEAMRLIPTRNKFIGQCRAKMKDYAEQVEATAECAREESCEAQAQCNDKLREDEWAKEHVKEIEGYVANTDWASGFRECRYLGDRPDPALLAACERVYTEGMPALVASGKGEDVRDACQYNADMKRLAPSFAKACQTVMAAELEQKKKDAIAARDAAQTDTYALCADLRRITEAMTDDDKKQAETLCSEMSIAASAKQGLEEARASISYRRSEISYYCSSAVDSLWALDPRSDWANQTLDELLRVCYIEAGKLVVEIELENQYPYCSYALTQIRDANNRFDLVAKDKTFASTIKKIDKLCYY